MLIRAGVVEQIGFLDERFFAYQEDADYCLRARRAGWKIFYVPDARVIHYGGMGGSRKRPYFGIYQWHRSYYLYYRKNLARDYPFWFHPLYYLVMTAKLMLSLVSAIVGTKKP
jgi:GT2 family glycosyltransferase